MALIAHRCRRCSHLDIFKRGESCCYDQCTHGRHAADLGEPEVITTFDGMGAPIAVITPPGSAWNNASLCDCDSCRALYEQQGGVA